jgi:hypothetical protein
MNFDLIDVLRDEDCPVCNGRVRELEEEVYVETCRIE